MTTVESRRITLKRRHYRDFIHHTFVLYMSVLIVAVLFGA